MFTKPDRRVFVKATNRHDGTSKSITLYGCDAEEVIEHLQEAADSHDAKADREAEPLSPAKAGGKARD